MAFEVVEFLEQPIDVVIVVKRVRVDPDTAKAERADIHAAQAKERFDSAVSWLVVGDHACSR